MEWISVKDRLPRIAVGSYSVTVLIAFNMIDIDGMYSYSAVSFGRHYASKRRITWEDEVSGYTDDDDGAHIEVTHWMPIPELPKE